MARRKKGQAVDASPLRNWCFKVKAIPVGGERIDQEMHRAHDYRNKRIAIERKRRADCDDVCEAHRPCFKKLKAEYAAANGEADRAKKKGCKATKQEAAARLKAAKKAWLPVKKEVYASPAVKAQHDQVNATAKVAQKAASKQRNCYWGTAQIIDESLQSIRSGAPPKFKPWRWHGWEGGAGVQIQAGKDKPPFLWENAFLDDVDTARMADPKNVRLLDDGRLGCTAKQPPHGQLMLQIQPLDARPTHAKSGKVLQQADPNSKRSQGRKLAIAWIRIASMDDPKKSPIWAKVLFHLHREPPPDTKIKRVVLHRELVGRRITWTIRFVLQRPEWDRVCADDGEATVEIKPVLVPGGVRVAVAKGSDGQVFPLVLSLEKLGRWSHAAELQSLRDDNYNAIRTKFAAWLKGKKVELVPERKPDEPIIEGVDDPEPEALPMVKGRPVIPDWCCPKTKEGKTDRKRDIRYIKRWKRSERLTAFYAHWKEHRFRGDEKIFAAVESWYRGTLIDYPAKETEKRPDRIGQQRRDSGDNHYHNWQDAERAKAIRWRNEQYRRFAAKLARIYHTVQLPKIDYKKAKEKIPKGAAGEGMRLTWSIAAPGTLDRFIRERVAEVITRDNHESDGGFREVTC